MLRVAVLLSTLCALAYGCPNIISRSGWGARKVNCLTAMKTPVPYVVIHHTAGAACNSKAKCVAEVKAVQNLHINNNKWCDIGYSFLVGEDGNVYEGRGWNKVGAHAPSMNSRSIGISVMGNFMNRNPNQAALKAVQELIKCGISKGFIRKNYIVKGHRNVFATSCPGNSFYSLIQKWPRFNAKD
ncbi:peptidoglycan recognition protein 1-like [Lissotriton helveticus]